jgi:hypothetical protein
MNLKDQNNPAVLNAIAEIVKQNRVDALQEDQKNATVSTTKYANFKPSSVQEALIGNQHKIDHNKNNKIDAHDFKLMRSKKKAVEVKEEEEIEEADNKNKRTWNIAMNNRRKEQKASGTYAAGGTKAMDDNKKTAHGKHPGGMGDRSSDEFNTPAAVKAKDKFKAGYKVAKEGFELTPEEQERINQIAKDLGL